MFEITSTTNPLIKELKSLHQKKYRDQLGKFFLEGIKGVQEAFESDITIEMVVVDKTKIDNQIQDIISRAQQKEIQVIYVSGSVFNSLGDTQSPQGIGAVVLKFDYSFDDIDLDATNSMLLLENVQDPGNMGTIIRTADAAGFSAVIALGGVDIYNPKVIRSTMGSIFHLPIVQTTDLENVLQKLKDYSIKLIASDLSSTNYHWDIDFDGKICLAIGNESKGISQILKENSGDLVKIPMVGRAESLNASIAAAILMYEAVRKR